MALSKHPHGWHKFKPGTRVLDTVTGLEGLVVGTTLTKTLEAAAKKPGEVASGGLIPLPKPVIHESVTVQLEDDSIVERSPRVITAI